MENRILDDNATNQSNLSGTDREYLFIAAKWARFLGIVGFVMAAFIAIAAFFITSLLGATMPMMGQAGAAGLGLFAGLGAVMTFIYLLLAAFLFFNALYMYNFGTKTKLALASDDAETLTEGFKNLKSFFKLSGMVSAIFLGFYALLFVIGIVASLFAR